MPVSPLQRVRGSLLIATGLRADRRAPWLPRADLFARRDARVRETVLYAARHVPYYRELFAECARQGGPTPDAIRTADDLARLPLLDKELVRREPARLLADTAAGRSGLSFLTSGTSGTPTRVTHDRPSLLRNIVYGERERAPVNAVCGSFRPRELYVGYETSTFKAVTAFYAESVLFPVKPRRRFVSLREPIARVAEIAQEERPDVLVGYGGWLEQFFRMVAAQQLPFTPPTVVMYMGEALPLGGREFIEERFGCRVMSRYNAVESFKIAYSCGEGDGLHLHDDLCHVRIVDAEGRDVPDGEQGRVVISNLINRGSVLLNYPIGDLAGVTSEPCRCGRTGRRLLALEGRVEDLIVRPGGRFVHPRSVWQQCKDDPDVIQFQLVQHELERFTLSLVCLTPGGFTAACARIVPKLRQLLGSDAVFDTVHHTEFLRAAGTKYRAVASYVPR